MKILVAVLAVSLLAGCTVVGPAKPANESKPVDQEQTEPQIVVLDAGTVVATGALTSVDGLTTGDVNVTADGSGTFSYTITNLDTPVTDEAEFNLSVEPFTEESYCAGGFATWVMGNVQLEPTISMSDEHWQEMTLGNPDFLDTVVLTSNNPTAKKTGCFYPVIASAPLTWTMPDLRRDLTVVDRGAEGGARGTVAADGGELSSYEVVDGDVLTEIAARFGVSVHDLFYLNPGRNKGQQQQAFAGELLNLSKSGR